MDKKDNTGIDFSNFYGRRSARVNFLNKKSLRSDNVSKKQLVVVIFFGVAIFAMITIWIFSDRTVETPVQFPDYTLPQSEGGI